MQELGKQPLFPFGSATMLAGIDPEAEARLVGLDQATKKATYSRYFTKDDTVVDIGEDVQPDSDSSQQPGIRRCL